MTAHVAPQNVKIGVLALQGAFIEHVHMMARLAPHPPVVVEVCFFFFPDTKRKGALTTCG